MLMGRKGPAQAVRTGAHHRVGSWLTPMIASGCVSLPGSCTAETGFPKDCSGSRPLLKQWLALASPRPPPSPKPTPAPCPAARPCPPDSFTPPPLPACRRRRCVLGDQRRGRCYPGYHRVAERPLLRPNHTERPALRRQRRHRHTPAERARVVSQSVRLGARVDGGRVDGDQQRGRQDHNLQLSGFAR